MKKFLFLAADFAAYIAIIFIAITLRRMEVNPHLFVANIYAMLPFFPLFTLILYIFSFYDVKDISGRKVNYPNLFKAFFANIIMSAGVLYFVAQPLGLVTPKTILVAVLTLYPAYIYISRRLFTLHITPKRNIIIFGKSKTINEIKNYLQTVPSFNIIAHKDFPEESDVVNADNLDFVLISSKLFSENKTAWHVIAANFIQKGILLKTDLNFYDELFSHAPKEGLQDVMWLLRGIGARDEKRIYPIIKKIADVCVAICLLPIVLPVGAIVYLLIAVIDKMPPLFVQQRVGYMEKTINIYKFRTMRQGTEEITALGSVLRRFRIDEFPQLFNILKGDISLVGPRPIWKNDYDILNSQIPGHTVRCIVKPGLTGWAQLNFKAPPNYFFINPDDFANDKEIFNDAFTRFSYDVWYIKNRSIGLDIEIILKTAKRMFIKDKNVAKQNS